MKKKQSFGVSGNKGPCFGSSDLCIKNGSSSNIVTGESKKHSYENKILDRETFEIEEYEVFQIIDKRYIRKMFQFINRMLKGIINILFKLLSSFFLFVFQCICVFIYIVMFVFCCFLFLGLELLFLFGPFYFIFGDFDRNFSNDLFKYVTLVIVTLISWYMVYVNHLLFDYISRNTIGVPLDVIIQMLN